MADDDVIVLCDPAVLGGGKAKVERRERGAGVRYSIAIQSEPLIHAFDPKTLGMPVARAMAEAIKLRIKAIGAGVSARTLEARKEAGRAFAAGKPWATKRYGGGRMGPMAPDQSSRAFNDSGRFAESIAVGPSDDAWRINVAANRLDERTTSGELGVRRIWNRLVQLVPVLARPLELFNDPLVQQGLRDSLGALVIKAEMRNRALTESIARLKIQTVRQVMGMLLQAA